MRRVEDIAALTQGAGLQNWTAVLRTFRRSGFMYPERWSVYQTNL